MTPKKERFLVLKEKPQQKKCSFCFGFDSALKTIDAQMSFWSVFYENALKKSYYPPKTPFWPFLAVINFCLVHFKNIDQNNMCVSTVLNLKHKKKFQKQFDEPQKSAFMSFETKT